MLGAWKRSRRLPEWPLSTESDGIALMLAEGRGSSVLDGVADHLGRARPGDYVAIQAYLTPNLETTKALSELRLAVRDGFRVATTAAFGPRYLHSTGQLHKGGPNSGVFIQIVDEERRDDVPIPGKQFTFGALIDAQALGDLRSLRAAGRRVARTTLPQLRAALDA